MTKSKSEIANEELLRLLGKPLVVPSNEEAQAIADSIVQLGRGLRAHAAKYTEADFSFDRECWLAIANMPFDDLFCEMRNIFNEDPSESPIGVVIGIDTDKNFASINYINLTPRTYSLLHGDYATESISLTLLGSVTTKDGKPAPYRHSECPITVTGDETISIPPSGCACIDDVSFLQQWVSALDLLDGSATVAFTITANGVQFTTNALVSFNATE